MMFKSRGLRLVIRYFFDAHLYDLKNKTNTATMKVVDFSGVSKELNTWKSSDYMVSWTSVVSKIFKAIYEYDPRALEFQFFDVGSGKGKVLLVWAEKLRERKIDSPLIGVEIDESLNLICSENFRKRNLRHPKLFSTSIFDGEIIPHRSPTIYFLYNPFDEIAVEKFCNLIDGVYLIVYVNPVHHDVISNFNTLIFSNTGWHPNMNFNIYVSKDY